MRIEQYDPNAESDRVRACHEIMVSAQPADDPNIPPFSLGMVRGWLVHDVPDEPRQCWLAAAESGTPLGFCSLRLPTRENRSNGLLDLVVAAGSRRRGIGTALLAHAARQAEAAGRTLLISDARVGSPGAAFADAVGANAVLQDARRILDVGPDLHARLPGLRAQAESRAAGYSLRRWIGPTPDDIVASACALNTAMADAPHSDNYEPVTYDADRLRAAEQRSVLQGTREYSVGAIENGTGEMAALTEVTVDPAGAPGWAYQQLTAVTRAHRGHRLGMLIKVAMLEWLADAEPQIRHIITYNAVPNQYMIAVNEALGHRVSDYFQSYELPVEAALKLPVSV